MNGFKIEIERTDIRIGRTDKFYISNRGDLFPSHITAWNIVDQPKIYKTKRGAKNKVKQFEYKDWKISIVPAKIPVPIIEKVTSIDSYTFHGEAKKGFI